MLKYLIRQGSVNNWQATLGPQNAGLSAFPARVLHPYIERSKIMRSTTWFKPKFYDDITVDLSNRSRYILEKDERLCIDPETIEIINVVTGYIVIFPSIQVLCIHATKKKPASTTADTVTVVSTEPVVSGGSYVIDPRSIDG